MGRERDGLAERERRDEEKVERNRVRQERAAIGSPQEAEVAAQEGEEEAPKPKSRNKKNSK
jgi:hypothetical protein